MNIAIITQARMSSVRLPGKVLRRIAGKTLLEYHVQRAQTSGYPVFVATSSDPSDAPIVRLCEKRNIPVCRGSLDDVLTRYYTCTQKNGLSTVIRITSDCPLIDGRLIGNGVKIFLKRRPDYLSNVHPRTYPRGFDFEIITCNALEIAFRNAAAADEREHVTPYIWHRPRQFEIENMAQQKDASQYRLTVDEPTDFELIRRLVEDFGADQKNYQEITEILAAHPKLAAINQHVQQKRN